LSPWEVSHNAFASIDMGQPWEGSKAFARGGPPWPSHRVEPRQWAGHFARGWTRQSVWTWTWTIVKQAARSSTIKTWCKAYGRKGVRIHKSIVSKGQAGVCIGKWVAPSNAEAAKAEPGFPFIDELAHT